MKRLNFNPWFNRPGWIIWLLILLWLTACNKGYEQYAAERAARALQAHQDQEDIVVGVAWPKTEWKDHFVDGVDLAIQEINVAGGVKLNSECNICEEMDSTCNQCTLQNTDCDKCKLNTQLCDTCRRQEISNGSKWGHRQITRLLEEEDYSDLPRATIRNADQLLAKRVSHPFVSNQEVIAVIGHPYLTEAIPAAVIYQYYGILFLVPATIQSLLTQPGFNLTFRTVPGTQQMADQLAGFCALSQHYRQMVILSERNLYGEELADAFAKTAADLGINIVLKGSFFTETINFKDLLAAVRIKKFDAILLAAWSGESAALIKQAREMGITQPFIGTEAMYYEDFILWAGIPAIEGMIIPTPFKPSFNKAVPFIQKFKEVYNDEPDTTAAQGYDNIKLLAHAIELANSSEPSIIATTLRYMKPWIGVTGVHSFDEHGEIKGKQYSFYQVRNGKFKLLPTAHLPYLFYKLDHRSEQTKTLEGGN